MGDMKTDEATGASANQPPALRRDAGGRVDPAALAGVIQWFLTHDPRVAVINHPAVEALFQWKQRQALGDDPEAFAFARAEDRLAVGIMQALVEHTAERSLHAWVTELLGALDEATRMNEAIALAYQLRPGAEATVVAGAEKIPSARERGIYLTSCWLETLCTAEIRVLGWVYQELYGRPFAP
jgi:hypothetical protein